MNIKYALGIAALVGLSVGWSVRPGAAAQDPVPRKQSLAIPVTTAGAGAGSVQCVVSVGPSGPIAALAFSPDGKKLAVSGYQEVLIWDLENGKLLKRIGEGQLSGFVHALAFVKEGLLAVGEGTPHGSGAVRIFDVESGKQTHAFEEPKDVVYSLAVSPDGKLLAAGGAEPVARVFSIEEKKVVATLEEHTDWVLGVSFNADGKLLATASADRATRVWNVETWESSVKLKESEVVHGAAFASDARILIVAVGGPDQWSCRVRRTDNVRSIRPVSTGPGMPLDVVWAAKTNRFYVPCSDGIVRVMDVNGRILASLAGHDDWVYCAAISADGAKLASGSGDGTVKLWNTADNRLLATLVQLAPRSDEWLVLTAQGYLAASSAGGLAWNAENVKTPPEKLIELFQNPESVRKAIAGEKVPPPTLE